MSLITKALALTSVLLLLSSELSSQNAVWVNHYTKNIQFNPELTSSLTETDLSGNSYLAAIHNFKLSYGTVYYGDVSLRKFDQSGMLVYNKIMLGKVVIDAVETDQTGNVYIAGSFMDTLRIDSVNNIYNTGSGFDVNYFVLKLSASGSFIWKKNINSIYGAYFRAESIRIRGNSIYLGICNFDTSYIKKFDLNGNEHLSILQTPVRNISSIDIDPSGNIVAGGACGMGSISFGGIPHTAPFIYNIYFVKYNSTGNSLWVRFVEDVTFQEVDVECDSYGNIVASGDLFDNVLFGNIQTQGPQWVYDFFLTKIDPSGNFLWVREVPNVSGSPTGDARKANVNGVAIDHNNNIYLAGTLRSTVDWGSGIVTSTTGSNDILLLKYDQNGNIIHGRKFGGASSDRSDDVRTDNAGNILLSGNFASTAMFDTISAVGTGYINSFLTKIPFGQSNGTINVSLIIEGFYDLPSESMRMSDTVMAYLHNPSSPYLIVDSAIAVVESEKFIGKFHFTNAQSGQYYLHVSHRNSVETWSAAPISFARGGIVGYDFTASASQAFGNNQTQVDNSPFRFAVYSGDVNQDGTVDASDAGAIDNDAFNFISGYVNTDITGDNNVDASDASIVDNNAYSFVGKVTP